MASPSTGESKGKVFRSLDCKYCRFPLSFITFLPFPLRATAFILQLKHTEASSSVNLDIPSRRPFAGRGAPASRPYANERSCPLCDRGVHWRSHE